MGVVIETIMVTIGALAAVRLLHTRDAANFQWFAIPGVLVCAALVPAWIGRREFPRLGLALDQTGPAARVFGGVCFCVFPAAFLGLWAMTRLHLPLPLPPIIPERQGWCGWLLYQFFYVAVAEEVFFRGYIQANLMELVRSVGPRASDVTCGQATNDLSSTASTERYATGLVILVSAGCFALAHVVVQGRITSLLTFLPGVILAWLFLRTGSLLAPILFHGLANVSYALIGLALARL